MPVGKFQQVKIANDHSITPDVIARNLSLSEKEVNRAILARTYDDYLKN
jgi:hypothetical protein